MKALPTGTVTFLFSDIEGSTRLLDELGPDRYAEVLAEHRRVMRAAFAAHGGVEVDTQGDAFFVAFPDAGGALAAAGEAQAALAEGPVRVRMGLHSGKPLVAAEGYVGMDVHRGARVMSAGHGGQVLVSEATFTQLGGGDELTDLGLHRLKDLTEPQRLWQLGDEDFPALKTLFQTNLPVQPTPLIGREAELAEVLDLLQGSRLVTLTGAGGSGKTRLALQAAAELVDAFKDGVWWVSLAALRDPELVEPTIAQVIGARDGLTDHLRSKQMLLLLDNFEQLLDAAPRIAAVLAEAAELHVLATSRERLGIAAEQEYAVPTLVPVEAVALFTARARQLKPRFEPNDTVAEICRRLDGLPLALELAAARAKVLRPEQILERLGKSLDLLTAGARDAPERQQTLRATIEWSHDLLSEDEKQLFARLAVFAGSFDLEAAERICQAELDTLQALVDKSLLRQTDEGRFFTLETIREYALVRLDESGDAERLWAAHARYFLGLAEDEASQGRLATRSGVDRLAPDVNNLFVAVERAADRRDVETIARFLGSTWPLWLMLGHASAALRWAESALEFRARWEPRLREKFLVGVGELLRHTGQVDAAESLKLELLQVQREMFDGRSGATLADLSDIALQRGDVSRARALAKESASEGGGPRATYSLAEIELREGDFRSSIQLFEEAAEGFRGVNDLNYAFALEGVAEAARRMGDLDRACSLFVASAQELMRLGSPQQAAEPLEGLAAIAAVQGRLEDAAGLAGVVARLREESGLAVWRPGRLPDELPPDGVKRGWELSVEAALAYARRSEQS